jgi:hypothetical protein
MCPRWPIQPAGQIIYGIGEDKKTHKPTNVDDGVTDDKITREWLH